MTQVVISHTDRVTNKRRVLKHFEFYLHAPVNVQECTCVYRDHKYLKIMNSNTLQIQMSQFQKLEDKKNNIILIP